VDGAVNGMCDRGGIAALEEVAMALTILYGMDLGIRLDRLGELSRLVQRIARVPLQPYKPIVGKNLFVQTTDAHIVAELKGKWYSMNPFDPKFIGGRGKILFGPQALNGQGLQAKIESMGLSAGRKKAAGILAAMEKRLKKQKSISEKEAERMIRKEIASKKKGSA